MNLLLLILLFFGLITQKSCDNYFKEYVNYLGTKTPYRIVLNNNHSQIKHNDCRSIKIWMVIRHGTRNPSKEIILNMNNNLTEFQNKILNNFYTGGSKLNNDTIEKFHKWKPIVNDINHEKILVPEGEDEMTQLAERMSARFPDVLPNVYSNTSYKFRFTATQRTNASARYFATGLFGRNIVKDIWFPKPLKRDPVLRFYKLCDKWRAKIKKNSSATYERELFKKEEIVKKTQRKISNKLGFKKMLTFDIVHLMYMTCAFETSWNKYEISPWCTVFNKKSLKVMEYMEDLKYYWIDGYGYPLTYNQACPTIKNLVQFFERKDEYPKAVLYFTHSGTMLKLYAHLGLYKDRDILRHDNYLQQSKRLWKVSKIDPFGSNIAFVLFQCGDQEKILLLHQEKIITIPGCDDEFCNYDKFLNIFSNSINNCQFDEMCHL